MHYVEKLTYIGDPPKAVVGGIFIWTLLTKDVPVTRIRIVEMLGAFYHAYKLEERVKQSGIRLLFSNTNPFAYSYFIGEQVIILETLSAMLWNSIDAKATRFEMRLEEKEGRLCLIVSDDGEGVHPSVESKITREPLTTKANGTSATLYCACGQMEKIGATLSYAGKGLYGKGASFRMEFLQKMPA